MIQRDKLLDWRWSTHEPLNKLITSELKPELIVELGGGMYSTPIFISHDPEQFICIENDREWFEELRSTIPEAEIRHHDLGEGIHNGTFKKDITESKKEEIEQYYIELAKEVAALDFQDKYLFVDNFTCCRNIAINTLFKAFDIIAYHDCQPRGIKWYEYRFAIELKKYFDHYYLVTPDSWTGVFISRNMKWNIKEFERKAAEFSKQYAIENKIPTKKVYMKRANSS